MAGTRIGNAGSGQTVSGERSRPECRLCQGGDCRPFHDDGRRYFCCPECGLVFAHPECYLSAEDERAVYDRHQNSPDDSRYRQFLSRLFEPMAARLPSGSRGLDFGSGPGPTLSVMFEESGHTVSVYDPFYAPDSGVFQREYDFITASEVVEHLHRPREELDRLWGCLSPGGVLGIMTKRVLDHEAFSRWHYKNDPTHVCFFAVQTFEWLASLWGASLTVVGDDVVILEK